MMYTLKSLETRWANAENPRGEKSRGGLAGNGRKGAPCVQDFKPHTTLTLLDQQGPGMIRHIWMTFPPDMLALPRALILRIYWDGSAHPGVEVPVGDFFGIAHARKRPMVSELFSFQGGRGLNCWAPMPFAGRARVTLENRGEETVPMLFYQIDYTLGDEITPDTGYFHAQFRRQNPCPIHEDYVILDGVKGRGVFLGAVIGVRSLYRNSWWGEGEVKCFLDGEDQPTLCGTGTEDYIGFAWGLGALCTPEQGCALSDEELGLYSIYRLHTRDPIYFQDSIKVTIQQIGYGGTRQAQAFFGDEFRSYPAAGVKDGKSCYFDRSDDFCSVAYWYQALPAAPFAPLPSHEEMMADLNLEHEAGKTRRGDQ